MAELTDYLALTVDDARKQFLQLDSRRPAKRQVVFLPVETLLCLAASFVIDHRRYGSSSAPNAAEPVPTLARLFTRPNTSVLAKMANLDGSRSHGGRCDLLVGLTLREDIEAFSRLYRILMAAARSAGIGPERLPDFLGLESGEDLVLLGQEELTISVVETDLERRLAGGKAKCEGLTERQTERLLVAAARVGQHVFADHVLRNCGHRCVFCGLAPPSFKAPRMLLASHIKPWRDSNDEERLDHQNGLAACPTHDVAFDVGLLTVNRELRIHRAPRLREAATRDEIARRYFGRPPLRDTILLPAGADQPKDDYLVWHQERIFAA